MKREVNAIRLPFLVVGFKTYLQATGRRALRLAEMANEVSKEKDITIILVPQYTDIAPISQRFPLPLFAQHIDPVEPGSHTGQVLPEAVKEAGAAGTFINHSERRLSLVDIERTVDRAKQVGLLSCVCSDSPQLSARVAAFSPDIILIENPELIGTGRAVSKADPQTITGTLEAVSEVSPKVRIICGAGITSGVDVTAALGLGVVGVGAASAIIKASNPLEVMTEMAQALRMGFTDERARIVPSQPDTNF